MFRSLPVAGILVSLISLVASGLAACSEDAHPDKKADAGSPPDDATPGPGANDAHPTTRDTGITSRDAGNGAPTDASPGRTEDAPVYRPAPCTGPLPVMTVRDLVTNTESAPDLSCYQGEDAEAGAPADAGTDAGAALSRMATLRLAPLSSSFAGDPTVDLFFGRSTLGAPDATRTFGSDASTVSFSIPHGLAYLSARVHGLPRDGGLSVAEIREYGLPVPASGEPIECFDLLVASRALGINLALGGGMEEPSKALLLSVARDCSGNPLGGAQYELVDGETDRPVATGTAPAAPHSSYSQFGLPSTTCTFSSNEQQEASWMLVNAPVNVTNDTKTHAYRLRLKGRRRASDQEPVILREREIELFAGDTTFVRMDG